MTGVTLVPIAAGGGPPTGSAGGDLAGTYPNPTLALIGAATGPIGDASHVATTTIDAKGRVTALASTAIALAASGDVTGTLPGALTLATVNAAPGAYGSPVLVPVLTIDAKGRVTASSSAAVATNGLLQIVQLNDGAVRTSSSFASAVDLGVTTARIYQSSRTYRVRFVCAAVSTAYTTGNGSWACQISQDNGTAAGGTFVGASNVSNLAFAMFAEYVFVGDGLSHTFAIRGWGGANVNSWNMHGWNYLTVEDITYNA